jgi:6-pyruvoyl-tetrahydropterin synthase
MIIVSVSKDLSISGRYRFEKAIREILCVDSVGFTYASGQKNKIRKERNRMKTASIITVAVTVAGAHYYPESVRPYLQHSHRHDFKISVNIGVVDHNRQYEFYDVQEGIIAVLDATFLKVDRYTYNFGTRSCEHIANELFPVLSKKYPVVTSVAVFEDENNGATVVLDESFQELLKIRFVHGSVPPGVSK